MTKHKSNNRQANLLAWMLVFSILFLAAFLLLFLFLELNNNLTKPMYIKLIIGMVVSFTIAYMLNYAGQYRKSAILVVLSTSAVPWVTLLFDESILLGNYVTLLFVTIPIILSSFLLPTGITIVLSILQYAGVVLVLVLSPNTETFNRIGFLVFILLTALFNILQNTITHKDIKKITDQSKKLEAQEILLREQSVRDHLTNLYNRRYLEETLEREIQRSLRNQLPLGIIILDIDKFKHINDTLGHRAGDTAIRDIGRFISEQIRKSDIACRYGGDEFVLVLPDAPRDVMLDRAELLRKGVINLGLPVPLTISLGIAISPENGTDGDTLLKFADAAMYQAKSAGGNRVILADSSKIQGKFQSAA